MKLKNLACAIFALSMTSAAMASDTQLLAFPGAEGFGRYTLGARAVANPVIYHVTNLNDSGEGSFRDAVSQEGRIIVFDVAGTINLKSALVVKGNNTILGQTAPGEGIQVYGDRVSFSAANNLIVRHMRFRMGITGTNDADACGIANGKDMIFDHLSVLWGRDENFSVNWDNKNYRPANITIQNSIIGQGLQTHSCGGLIQTIGGVTLYRNLYIENKTRNPKVKGLNQFVNNVVYNWGNGGCYIQSDSEGDSWADIENNYFMKGPWNGATDPFSRGIKSFRYYGVGNYYDDNVDGVLNGHEMTIDEMSGKQSGTAPYSTYFASLSDLNNDITEYNDGVTAEDDKVQQIPEISEKLTAAEAYAWILANVGPLPVRDEVDQYLIDEMATYGLEGTKNGITSEAQLPHKGTGVISGGVKPQDSDGDGIPDEWEIANGLNPDDPSDALQLNPEGYTYIEAYSHTITGPYPYIKKPVNLVVTNQEKTSLSLSWDLNKNTDNGFEIEVSTDGKNFNKVAEVAAGVTSATVNGLTERTNYQVRIRAVGNGLASDYSDTLSTETIGDPSAPAQPTNPFPAVGAKEGIAAGITFTWEDNVKAYGGDVTYALYLGTSEANLAQKVTGLTKTEWTTKNLEANMTYYWRVDATNSIGTTTGDVWNFSTTEGGVLFYSDFHTQPEEYAAKWGNITDNTNIINAANTVVTYNDMKIGSGSNSLRIIAMPGVWSDDLGSDYGPASEEDRGASPWAVQFYTTSEGGYIETPEVQGPCVVTIYLGNTDNNSRTTKLQTLVGDSEVSSMSMAMSKKKTYKFTTTYMNAGPVKFRFDANGKKVNVNDILIERYVAADGSEPLELTAGLLENDIDYTDGSIQLTFNRDIMVNSMPTISGRHQFELINVSAAGTKLNISYDALDANSDYTISFAEGQVTTVDGQQSFIGNVLLSTGDFTAEKVEGDTHWGKAIAALPVNFAPFDVTAPFETVGSLVQTQQNDYPHWCQTNGGEITADYVAFKNNSSNDKVMAYFDGTAQKIYVNLKADEGTKATVKIQETRNPDNGAPTWRTIRVLTEADMPFEDELELNPESRFVKIVPTSVSGTVRLYGFRISDEDGFFGDDYDFEAGVGSLVSGYDDENAPIYNIMGIRVDSSYKGIVIKNGKKYIQR